MVRNPNPLFPAEKVAELKAAHAEYNRLKRAMLQPIVKSTIGKMNTLDTASAALWLSFAEENPSKITDKINTQDFVNKLDAADFLEFIEKLETEDQIVSKSYRDVISSDIRFYWANLEDYYVEAAKIDPVLKANYDHLPAVSAKRKSAADIEKAFNKLKEKRKKKNGTDNTVLNP